MKNTISDPSLSADGRILSWRCGDCFIEKKYDLGLMGSTFLKDGTGVVVVDRVGSDPNNAVIFNCDGSERVRVKNPRVDRGAICFSSAFYEGDRLILIIEFQSIQLGCEIDGNGGVLHIFDIR